MQADNNQLLAAIGALSDKVSAMDAKLTALDSKVNTGRVPQSLSWSNSRTLPPWLVIPSPAPSNL